MNAKREFLETTTNKVVLCATIDLAPYYAPDTEYVKCRLKKGYSQEDLQEFLKTLNFNYESGWGSQELFGTIWYTDGSWSERFEYDGAEHWRYKCCPDVDEDLL